MAPTTCHHLLPPFAEGLQTAPLVSVSFAKLESGDKETSEAFVKACKELGFFYLDMFGSELGEKIVADAEKLNEIQKVFFDLPFDVKNKYGRPHLDPFYAYRYYPIEGAVDENGDQLKSENYNLRKDDILGNCERLACHPMILENQEVLERYTVNCRAAIDLMLERINTFLELPVGTLRDLHRIHECSGDHVRFTQAPPREFDEAAAQRGEHTDFGSITILFNWLGGLQIRMPETNEWVWVRPVPGSAVVNLGDALTKFTAGLLRSNIHRVVPPVGEQKGLTRNSLVFFSRPENTVVLKRLVGGIIDGRPDQKLSGPELSAHDWIMAKSQGKLPNIFTPDGFELREDQQHLKDAIANQPLKVSGVA